MLVPPPQTTKDNKHHYIRTDDGESLCKYIEAFRKNPEQAMVCVCARVYVDHEDNVDVE